jgi:hypothetical protein
VTLAPKGLLIEEARTNSIRNNTMQGAVVGTPGTIPTNWIVSGSINGLTREVVSVGIEGGISYVDVRWSGTPTATSLVTIFFEPNNQIVAANGQSWSYSLFTRLVSGSTTNVGVVRANIIGNTSAGSGVSGQGGFVDLTPTSSSLSSQRTVISRTFTDATVERVNANIAITYTNGNPIDLTLRIGLPQLEQGAFATSPILTTTATATRAADVAVMTGANFSNWYTTADKTLYVEHIPSQVSVYGNVLQIDDGTNSNRISFALLTGATGQMRYDVSSGGVTSVNTFPSGAGNSFAANTIVKASFAMSIGSTAPSNSLNGGAAVGATGAQFTAPTVEPAGTLALRIGHRNAANAFINGHIRRIGFFPRRLADAELTSLTS